MIILTGITASLLFLIFCNISAFAFQCNHIRENTIRLHVIANSDSFGDQSVKLLVRDAVLETGCEIFDGTMNISNAKEIINRNISAVNDVANNVLTENNIPYRAKAVVCREYFPTRVYENNVTLPAGEYLAVKIILGEGKGENWWCVMFPALCLSAASVTEENKSENVYSQQENIVIKNAEKYEIRFKLIEYIEKLKSYG